MKQIFAILIFIMVAISGVYAQKADTTKILTINDRAFDDKKRTNMTNYNA